MSQDFLIAPGVSHKARHPPNKDNYSGTSEGFPYWNHNEPPQCGRLLSLQNALYLSVFGIKSDEIETLSEKDLRQRFEANKQRITANYDRYCSISRQQQNERILAIGADCTVLVKAMTDFWNNILADMTVDKTDQDTFTEVVLQRVIASRPALIEGINGARAAQKGHLIFNRRLENSFQINLNTYAEDGKCNAIAYSLFNGTRNKDFSTNDNDYQLRVGFLHVPTDKHATKNIPGFENKVDISPYSRLSRLYNALITIDNETTILTSSTEIANRILLARPRLPVLTNADDGQYLEEVRHTRSQAILGTTMRGFMEQRKSAEDTPLHFHLLITGFGSFSSTKNNPSGELVTTPTCHQQICRSAFPQAKEFTKINETQTQGIDQYLATARTSDPENKDVYTATTSSYHVVDGTGKSYLLTITGLQLPVTNDVAEKEPPQSIHNAIHLVCPDAVIATGVGWDYHTIEAQAHKEGEQRVTSSDLLDALKTGCQVLGIPLQEPGS